MKPEIMVQPKKSLGQHFLRDRSALGKIVAAADVDAQDQVLEIGPGPGVLTRELITRADRVVAVELDERMLAHLRTGLGHHPNLELVHADALDFDPCGYFRSTFNVQRSTDSSTDWSTQHTEHGAQNGILRTQNSELRTYKLVGNIPYYITGPLLRHYLEAECRASVLVLMVQLEVARRIVARPGDMSLLAVSVQFYAKPSIVARVPAGAFYPPPNVDSAILKLVPYPGPAVDVPNVSTFFRVARAGFSTRRKQLANALVNGLDVTKVQAQTMLTESRIAPEARAEQLELSQWASLAWSYSRIEQVPRS